MGERAVPQKPISDCLARHLRIRVDPTQTILADKSAPQASKVIVLTPSMAINQDSINLRIYKIKTRVSLVDSSLLLSIESSRNTRTIIPTLAQTINSHLSVRNCKSSLYLLILAQTIKLIWAVDQMYQSNTILLARVDLISSILLKKSQNKKNHSFNSNFSVFTVGNKMRLLTEIREISHTKIIII